MIEVHLDLTQAPQNLVVVRLAFEPVQRHLQWSLPAWTPGSYLIRDYVRFLEGLELLQGGVRAPIRRLGPAQWEADLHDLAAVELRYRLQAHELTVRTCHVDGDHAFLALAAVVLQVEGHRWSPHRLHLQRPAGWQVFLPLPGDDSEGWLAGDFDALVDAPLEAGPHQEHAFTVAGVPHRWVTWGEDLPSRDPRWLEDVERVCACCCRLLGEATPAAPHYLLILHLREEGYGGLEHDNASVLLYGRRALARPEGRRRLLQLVAHEYLHQWNVRRLRPAPLAPVDYDHPTPVSGLWFAEGVTSYLDPLIPHAAGLCSEAELLDDLGADLSRYRLTPGRHVQSLHDSAEEAWVTLYRQDGQSRNNQVSYYLKGAVVAMMLDLHLRRHGSALILVLRDLWRSFGRCRRGYRSQDLIDAFASHAADLSTMLPIWLNSTDDPDMEGYLDDVGLRLVAEHGKERYIGWQLREAVNCGAVEVSAVDRGSPAASAGVQIGDEILALDHQRLRSPSDSSQALPPDHGDPTEVLLCRDGLIRTITLASAPPAVSRWRLEPVPEASDAVLEKRRRWLSLTP